MQSPIRLAFVLLAAFSLIAGACGDDDDTSVDEETTDTSVVEESNETAADDAATADDQPTDLSAYGTDRPESLVGGAVFDAMTFLTFPPEMAVCTSETLLSTTTEEELLAAGIDTIEESAVEAARECGADEEAMESLRTTLRRDAELNGEESG